MHVLPSTTARILRLIKVYRSLSGVYDDIYKRAGTDVAHSSSAHACVYASTNLVSTLILVDRRGQLTHACLINMYPTMYLLVDPEHVRLVGQQLGLLDAVIDACPLRQ